MTKWALWCRSIHIDIPDCCSCAATTQQLQEMVTRLGPRPLLHERSAAEQSASEHLCAALGQLGQAFTANVPLSGDWTFVVLHVQPRDGFTVPIVLLTKDFGCFSNQEYRCAILLSTLYITAMHGQKSILHPYLLLEKDIISQHAMCNSSKLH